MQKHPDSLPLQSPDAQLFLRSGKCWMCPEAGRGCSVLGSGLISRWAEDRELWWSISQSPWGALGTLHPIPCSSVKSLNLFSHREASKGDTVSCQHSSFCGRSSVGGQALSCHPALCTQRADVSPRGAVTQWKTPLYLLELPHEANRFQRCSSFLWAHPG